MENGATTHKDKWSEFMQKGCELHSPDPEGTACEKDVESSKSLECLKNDEELSGGEVVMGGRVGVVKQREGCS